MTRNEQIERIIRNYFDGLETLTEATARLDALKVRGGFQQHAHRSGFRYCGYDYEAQRWVEVAT